MSLHQPPLTHCEAIGIVGVDDHPIVLDGIRSMIQTQRDLVMVGEACTAAEAFQAIRCAAPDVVLMDLNLPDMSGIKATETIKHTYPSVRVIILTTYCGEEDVRRAMEAGASGYLLKEGLRNQMITAIRAVHHGDQYLPIEISARLKESLSREPLTQRELEALSHASNGLANSEIATVMGISLETVKSHMKAILRKLGVADRTQAILTAFRRGVLHINDGRRN